MTLVVWHHAVCLHRRTLYALGMSELLFELYTVPQVSYGIDALFSLYHNQPKIRQSVC